MLVICNVFQFTLYVIINVLSSHMKLMTIPIFKNIIYKIKTFTYLFTNATQFILLQLSVSPHQNVNFPVKISSKLQC